MRPSVAVLVALLAVLAGCGSGTSPSATGTPTTEPATEPTTEGLLTPGPDPDSGSVPDLDPASVPGVRADGANVTRLTAAHDAALNRTAYTMNASVRRGDARQRIVVETSGPLPTLLRRETGSTVREEYYDEGRFYRREVADGDVSYRVGPFVGDPSFSGAGLLREYMSRARYAPTGTATRGGDPVVVLAADREDLRQDAFGDATAEAFASRAGVDADGVVRSFVFAARGTTADGRPFVVRVELRVTGIGDTVVGAPGWLDEAREATSGDGTPTAAAVRP